MREQQPLFFEPTVTAPHQRSLFPLAGAEVIHCYTRREAIADGVLVQLSGPGYKGDQLIPHLCEEAGFRFPIAVTAEVFREVIDVHPEAELALNDLAGRLWDVLWMLKQAIRRSGSTDVIRFQMAAVLPLDSQFRTNRLKRKATEITLKSICGPDDNGDPCITIMWPHQD